MKKTLLRIALAAGLVGAANWAMTDNNEVKASERTVQEERFEITDPNHEDYDTPEGANLTLNQADQACPGAGPVCATGDQGTQVEWNGSSTKF